MHAAAEGTGAGDCVVQCAVRRAVGYADAGRDRGHRRHRAHPDDVVDVDIISEDGLLAAVQVDDCRIARLIDAEIIQPAAVLAEFVTIVPVLGGRIDVADENGYTVRSLRLHAVNERLTPPDIYVLCKHNKAKIGNSDGISEKCQIIPKVRYTSPKCPSTLLFFSKYLRVSCPRQTMSSRELNGISMSKP